MPTNPKTAVSKTICHSSYFTPYLNSLIKTFLLFFNGRSPFLLIFFVQNVVPPLLLCSGFFASAVVKRVGGADFLKKRSRAGPSVGIRCCVVSPLSLTHLGGCLVLVRLTRLLGSNIVQSSYHCRPLHDNNMLGVHETPCFKGFHG